MHKPHMVPGKPMKEIEAKKVKNFGYLIGQVLVTVFVACLVALMIGGTYAALRMLF